MKAKKKSLASVPAIASPALALAVPAPAPAPAARQPSPEEVQRDRLRTLMEIATGTSRSASFALSLLIAVQRGKVSEKQAAAIDRLLADHANPLPAASFPRLIGAFKALPAGTKRFPKVRGVVDGVEVVIGYVGLASDKAKPENRGTASVASGAYGTPENRYYGRILADGTFVPGGACSPAVLAWLQSMEEGTVVWSY